MNDDFVNRTVIDVCNRSFLIISDDGEEKTVTCETTEQFMDVMEVVTELLQPERIKYADLAIYEKSKGRKRRKRKSS
tara:strand:- start:147 stop:377 length:231 start_codon:yes stop_codon:yes gene_type:complete